MRLVVNPGETKLTIAAMSGFPGPYCVEYYLNARRLGCLQWSRPGRLSSEFLLPPRTEGRCEVMFRVPHLWQPSSCVPGSQDQRRLGIGISAVTIE